MVQQLFLFDEEQVEGPVEQDNSNNTPVLGLLSKFDAIEVTSEQRISEEELEYCQLHEKIFFETRDTLTKVMDDIYALYEKYKKVDGKDSPYEGNNYLHYYSDIDIYPKKIKDVYSAFVSRITNYFAKKHNVSLSSEEIKQKYTDSTITYTLILDEIFEQLGGLTFKEKAVSEIKAASKNAIYNPSNVSITKNKLSIGDYVWWDSGWDNATKISYRDSRVRPLFYALSNFITGGVNMTHTLQDIHHQLERGSIEYDIFTKSELQHDVLQAIKFFKNGKVELFFADNSQAETFKKEYLV